jgi:hypothetical protein
MLRQTRKIVVSSPPPLEHGVYEFFQKLRERQPAADPLLALDPECEVKFAHRLRPAASEDDSNRTDNTTHLWTQEIYTERSLFERIVEYLRTTPVAKDEPIASTRRKVWHLLGHFHFTDQQALESIREEIDTLLLALVDRAEQVAEKRGALLEWLLTKATRGNVEVRPDDLLAEFDLDVTPLTDWVRLRDASRRILRTALKLRQYDPNANVQQSTIVGLAESWLTGPSLLGLEGESGNGKSWLLYGLAKQLVDRPAVVVLIEATGDADTDIQKASDCFWQRIKGNGGAVPLNHIADRRKSFVQQHADNWLVVLIDGVQDANEAAQLALKPVEDWGVRLAITGDPEVVSVFMTTAGDRIHVVPVAQFNATERDEFLAQRLGDQWVDVPSDVKDTLRRPLLASLYCREIAHPLGWRPTNEYELYDQFWQSLSRGKQARFPHDVGRLAQLALTVLDNVAYPWPAEVLDTNGLDAEMIERLIRVGWLRRASQNCFEIYHDRLLNYAVAWGLLRHHTGKSTMDELASLVREMFVGNRTYSQRRLGYVPMDLLHLILADESRDQADRTLLVASLIESLDDLSYSYRKGLYTELLPTLGAPIVPVLFNRLFTTVNTSTSMLQEPIIESIVSFDLPEVRHRAIELLNGTSPAHRRIGVRILVKRPEPTALDRLWQVHCEMQEHPDLYEENARVPWLLYEESFSALRACVRLDPRWLERTIDRTGAGHAHIQDLAYLVANLQDDGQVWRRCKAQLFDKVPEHKARSIAQNIARFRDVEGVTWLLTRVHRTEDMVGAAALHALARSAPDHAIEQLIRLADSELYISRGWYLPLLLEIRRDQVQ